ncbi:L-idonate 5-dehydrogenase [Sodalis sp. RH19]|uniref:L-idonate 5-dehydrogenase n=1 Tax=unclassified Sodalis (in: enterobacteria) TaxID=2636512 RepID=UPI0039B3C2F2
MNVDTQSCVVTGKKAVAVVAQNVEYSGQGTLVKISRGGICGSDLHYYQEGAVGNFKVRQPMILGHEVIGHVVKSDAPGLSVNQSVAINPSKPCKQCKYCLSGEENQCINMRFFGSAMYFPHVDGGFTQFKVVDTEQCIPFDNALDERVMAFAEPLAVAIHAVNQAGDVKGKTVFVSGVGPIGSLLVAAAKASGAREIICADLSQRCLDIAAQMGATKTLHAAAGDFSAYADQKGYFDIAFEASGHPQSITRCLELTRARGTLVQVGMGGVTPEFPMMMVIAKEIRLVGSFRFTTEFNTAVAWLGNGTIDPLPLLSGEYPQAELEQALIFAADKSLASKVQLVF